MIMSVSILPVSETIVKSLLYYSRLVQLDRTTSELQIYCLHWIGCPRHVHETKQWQFQIRCPKLFLICNLTNQICNSSTKKQARMGQHCQKSLKCKLHMNFGQWSSLSSWCVFLLSNVIHNLDISMFSNINHSTHFPRQYPDSHRVVNAILSTLPQNQSQHNSNNTWLLVRFLGL